MRLLIRLLLILILAVGGVALIVAVLEASYRADPVGHRLMFAFGMPGVLLGALAGAGMLAIAALLTHGALQRRTRRL